MRILITGGTGSLGHALVGYYLANTDHSVIVYSRDEWKQAMMRERFPHDRLEFYLGDVRDRDRLRMAFRGKDVVIHAAALKRVDSTARDPQEIKKTNVDGTENVLLAAEGQVAKVLLISTDKACYATNAYGTTKALGEWLVTAFNVYGVPQHCSSSVVRYGNVLGSRGSVVTAWQKQLREGKPLTLTDAKMTRFLITMPMAVQMIQVALDQMTGGEIFVPKLRSHSLLDLASVLSGPEYPMTVVGLRPGGEKLHETLMTDEECEVATEYGPQEPDSLLEGYAVIPPVRAIQPHGEVLTPSGIGRYGWRSDRAPRWLPEELERVVKDL